MLTEQDRQLLRDAQAAAEKRAREWNELEPTERKAVRLDVAEMLMDRVIKPHSPWFWDAIQDIGRDWVKRNAPELLERKEPF